MMTQPSDPSTSTQAHAAAAACPPTAPKLVARSSRRNEPAVSFVEDSSELPIEWQEKYLSWFINNFIPSASTPVYLEGSTLPATPPYSRPPSYTSNLHQLLFEFGITFVPYPSHSQFLSLIDTDDNPNDCKESHRTLFKDQYTPPTPAETLIDSDDIEKPKPETETTRLFIENLPLDWTARQVYFLIKVLTGIDVIRIQPIMIENGASRLHRLNSVLIDVYSCHKDPIITRLNQRVMFDENGLWVATDNDQLRMFDKYARFIGKTTEEPFQRGPGYKHLYQSRPDRPITVCDAENIILRTWKAPDKKTTDQPHPLCGCSRCSKINSNANDKKLYQAMHQYLAAIQGKVIQPHKGESFIDIHSRVPPQDREPYDGGCKMPVRPYNVLLSAGKIFAEWQRTNDLAGSIDFNYFCSAQAQLEYYSKQNKGTAAATDSNESTTEITPKKGTAMAPTSQSATPRPHAAQSDAAQNTTATPISVSDTSYTLFSEKPNNAQARNDDESDCSCCCWFL